MGSGPTISIRYAHRILETAAAAGIDQAALAASVGLQPILRAGDIRISGSDYMRLWGEAMTRVNDPAFPLQVAASTGIETYGVFGFATMTSVNFREGLDR